MSSNIKVAHVSSVHFAHDPRVVYRTAFSIAARYNTTLIITNAPKNYEKCPELNVISIQKYPKIWQRALWVHPVILCKLLILNPKIIHLHDPELMVLGLFFKLFLGKKIIFDNHENIKKQLPNKVYNNHIIYQKIFGLMATLAKKHFFWIFAEAHQPDSYTQRKLAHIITLNYPDIDFYTPYINLHRTPMHDGKINLFYIGGISTQRCIDVMIHAVAILKRNFDTICLHIIGDSYLPAGAIQTMPHYNEVKNNLVFYGKQSPEFGFEISKKCLAGLSIIKPMNDYADSYPTKTYEYMCVGLPVVTADLPHFIPIVHGTKAGFCVNPYDAQAVADAIKNIIQNPETAHEMAKNGYEAAKNTYNWQLQADKLLGFYHQILEKNV